MQASELPPDEPGAGAADRAESDAGTFVFDHGDGRYLFCSQAFARLRGGSGTGEDRLHPEDRARYQGVVDQAVAGRRPYAVDYRVRGGEGTIRWLREAGDVWCEGSSGACRIVGTVRELTPAGAADQALEQRVALRTAELAAARDAAEAGERAARASNERLLAAAEALMDGLAIYDADERLVYYNSRYPEHAPAALRERIRIGARFADLLQAAAGEGGLYHPDMGRDYVEQRLTRRDQPSDHLFRVADGRWMRVRESVMPGGGRVLLTRDVTDRRLQLAAHEERERLWRAIAEAVPLPLVIARIDEPEILFANALAADMFGLQTGHQADAVRAAYVRREDHRALIERLLAEGRADQLEIEMRRADGALIWTLLSARAVSFDGRPAMLATAIDITGRRAAEEALRASEARFQSFMDNAPVGMFVKGLDDRMELVSPGISLVTGLPAAEMLGRTAAELVPAETAVRIAAADRELVETGQVIRYEERIQRQGEDFWNLVIRFPIRDGDGRITRIGGFRIDITERKRMEQALRASEARLAAFMEHAPVGMYVKDLDGRYVLANPEMSKVFRVDARTMIGRTVRDCPGGASAALHVAQCDAEVLRTGNVSVVEDHTGNPDTYQWDLVIRFPIRDAEGRITHLAGFDVDITERKQMEEALKASEQRFRVFAEAHPVPVVINRLEDARILFASPPFLELLRTSYDDLARGELDRFYADPADREQLLERIRREGSVRDLELQLRRTDGSLLWVSFNSRLIDYEGGAAIVSGLVDITEQKRAQTELERQRERLHQNEKMSVLGSLLAGVAHELNNPLSVVVGQAMMLEELAAERATAERAAKIRAAADRCARIVKTFLAMARSRPPERGEVRLNDLVRSALEIAAYGLRSTGVELVLELDPQLPPLWADADQLHQVLTNLIVNARQAMQSGQGPRRLLIRTGAEPATGAVVLELLDTGPGIPEEVRRQVFDPFFTTKPPGIGTGIGLSVSKRIVQAHSGTIEVQNRPVGGAHFTLRLPCSQAGATPSGAVATALAAAGTSTVLVVDDEPDVAAVLADILRLDGLGVDVADGGRTALERLARKPYDLVISDLRMPDMDGPALYRELQRRQPEQAQRMMFVTGDTLSADAADFLAASGAPVIEKPFDAARVRQMAAEHLALLRARRRRAGAG